MFEKGTLMHKPTAAFVAVAILSVATMLVSGHNRVPS
jgi:hypothetical protein